MSVKKSIVSVVMSKKAPSVEMEEYLVEGQWEICLLQSLGACQSDTPQPVSQSVSQQDTFLFQSSFFYFMSVSSPLRLRLVVMEKPNSPIMFYFLLT